MSKWRGSLRFSRFNIEFEVPDEWLIEGGLHRWLQEPRASHAYRVLQPPYPPDPQDGGIPQAEAIVVPLDEIEPVRRTLANGTPFCKERLLRILAGFRDDQPLPPVHTREAEPGTYRFCLFNGFHRFHASVAAGFTHIPVVTSPRIKP